MLNHYSLHYPQNYSELQEMMAQNHSQKMISV